MVLQQIEEITTEIKEETHRYDTDSSSAREDHGGWSCSCERETSECSLEVLRFIMEHIEQGGIVIDEDMNLLFANGKACRILSVDNKDDAGRTIRECCSRKVFDQSKGRGSVITYVDVAVPGRDVRKLLGVEILHLHSPSHVGFYLVLLNDFSKWKEFDEMRSRFTTSLSHRFRTPLTAARNAIKILTGPDGLPGSPERERLLDIVSRNTEKLVSHLDELQKIFMIDSEEMNVCRALVSVRKEIDPIFAGLKDEDKIRGYRVKIPDLELFTGRGRLKDFITTLASAFEKWQGCKVFIDCVGTIEEELQKKGGISRKLKLSFKPRSLEHCDTGRAEQLDAFLSYNEAHQGLLINSYAAALEGRIEITNTNAVNLFLPMNPSFNYEKDLVHPLHMMKERAELVSSELHLVDFRMIGEIGSGARLKRHLEKCIFKHVSGSGMVAMGGSPLGYLIYVVGKTADEVSDIMRNIQKRFDRICGGIGEEIFPSLRWEIRYSYANGEGSESANPIAEELNSIKK